MLSENIHLLAFLSTSTLESHGLDWPLPQSVIHLIQFSPTKVKIAGRIGIVAPLLKLAHFQVDSKSLFLPK